MDSRIAWIQPEQFGPATALWQRLWENSQLPETDQPTGDGSGGNTGPDGGPVTTGGPPAGQGGQGPPKRPMQSKTHFTPQVFNKMKVEKADRLRAEGIPEISPLAVSGADFRLDNPASSVGLPFAQLVQKQNARWRTRSSYPHGVQGLHNEIVDFYRWMSSTPEEYIMRFDVVS